MNTFRTIQVCVFILSLTLSCQNANEQKPEPFIIYEDAPPSACDCVKNAAKAGIEGFDKILQKRCEVYAEKLSTEEKEARALEGMRCLTNSESLNSNIETDCGECSIKVAQSLANDFITQFKNSQVEVDAEYARDIELLNIEQRPNCSYVATFKVYTLEEMVLKEKKTIKKRFECDGKEMYMTN